MKKNFLVCTIVPDINVSVSEDVFNRFIDEVSVNYVLKKHYEEISESTGTSYLNCYDALDEYGFSLGTFAFVYECEV